MAISAPDHFPSSGGGAIAGPSAESLDALAVLYDADCGVCREAVRQLRRWDRGHRFEFVSFAVAASSGRPLLERMAAERPLGDSLHVLNETTGEVSGGGHAALAILDGLPGGWLLRPWAALPTTSMAADVVYRVASRHRDRVAWLVGIRDDVTCPLESPPPRHERR